MKKSRFFGFLTIFCALLAVLLVVNPTKAEAATVSSGTCGENLTWELDDQGCLTISGNGAMNDWYSLSRPPWYSKRSSITKVVIGQGVTTIGSSAFSGCSLTDVTVPDSVTTIGDNAFYGATALQNATLGSGVVTIGQEAFSGCRSLISVNIPVFVTTIGYRAFYGCTALTHFYFNAANMNDMDKEQCLFENAGTKDGYDGITLTVGPKATRIPAYLFYNAPNVADHKIVAITFEEGSVCKSIGAYAFYDCDDLGNTVTLADSVQAVENFAFYSCGNLVQFNAGSGLETIGDGVFKLSNLSTMRMGDSVESIGQEAFASCTKIYNIDLSGGLITIGQGAFTGCTSLRGITIPDSVTTIGANAFLGCTNLDTVTLGAGLKTIGGSAFKNCTRLSGEVVIPEGVTDLGTGVFYNCASLTAVTIPGSVSSIGMSTFRDCAKLTSVTIGQGVESIDTGAFYCSGLTTVTLPSSVVTMKSGVFDYSNKLKEVWFAGVIPPQGQSALSGLTATAYYPDNDELWTEAIRNSFGGTITWIPYDLSIAEGTCGDGPCYSMNQRGILTISGSGPMDDYALDRPAPWVGAVLPVKGVIVEAGVTHIGSNAFSSCPELESVVFEEGSVCKSIGYDAFSNCEKLTAITLPASLETIGSSAFISCTGLTEIALPDSVTTLDYYAFYGCDNLQKLTIGKSVKSGLTDAFVGCDKLCTIQVDEENLNFSTDAYGVLFNKNKTVLIRCFPQLSGTYTIPDTVKQISDRAFELRYNLTGVTIPEGVTKIGGNAFSGCSSLTQITIPEGVVTIGSLAFSSCEHLTAVSLPDSVQSVGENAFDMCLELKTVYLGKGVTELGMHVFGFTGVWDSISVHEDNPAYCSVDGVLYSKDMKTIIRCPKNKAGAFTIPEGVVTVSPYCFYDCKGLTAVSLPDSLETIGTAAFCYCTSVTEFDLPEGLRTIDTAAFSGCMQLTEFVIPDSVEVLNRDALGNCESLQRVIVGKGVKRIYGGVFTRDEALNTVIFTGNMPQMDGSAFDYVMITAWYPSGDSTWTAEKLQDYYGGWVTWKPFEAGKTGSCGEGVRFELDEGGVLTVFTEAATRNSIRGTMTSAPWNMLYSNEIKVVVIEDGVRNVVAGAFKNCGNLETVTVAKTVTDIGGSAFANCKQLKTVTFEGSAPTVATNAFAGSDTAVYYPADDESWNDEIKEIIGSTTFVPVGVTKFDIDVARMILGNALEFQFGVAQSKLTDTTGVYAVIEKGDVTKTIPATQWGSVGPYYAIVYDGLAAKEMADEICVTIYNAEGEAISNPKTDSVRAYVARAFDSQTAEGKTMMVDMLNYGAAAQVKFNYNTGDLANNQLTEAQKACGTATLTATVNNQAKGPNFKGTRLVLESRIQMQVAFSGMDRTMYAVYSYTDHNGNAQSVTVKGQDFISVNGMYGIELSELVYADARSLVTVRVYNADGTLYSGAKDSIQSYVNRSGETAPLFNALMKFADSAKVYLQSA